MSRRLGGSRYLMACSDLAIWRQHLVTESDLSETRIVVLNKIDTMWDILSTPAQIDSQIQRQL